MNPRAIIHYRGLISINTDMKNSTSSQRSCMYVRTFILLILAIWMISGCTPKTHEVAGPVVVGSPPENAFIGLMMTDNGEIRHYTYSDRNSLNQAFYIRSNDLGVTWDTIMVDNPLTGADVKSPVSGEYIRLASSDSGVVCIRSKGGIDGQWEKELVYRATPDEGRYIMLKPPVFVRKGQRILVGAHSSARFGCGVFYSDDDGDTWQRSQFVNAPDHQPGGLHKGYRWNHGAVEPTVVELNDGRIWMLARTAQDHHYESFSHDGGATWEPLKPSRFYATITMPTIGRLKDGRLLFLWNNTAPLPEKEGTNGVWEDVFTNRDVLHAAISDDDGKTWTGFRELYLNPNRNDPRYAEADQSLSLDMSVHQTQFVELPDGQILVSLGQHEHHRKLLKFDPEWLVESSREDDFSEGLDDWSTFLYKKGIVGHCAYNRAEGASLAPDPQNEGRQVLHIAREDDPTIETPHQGAVWNFPASGKGYFETEIYVPAGSQGGTLSLHDRWFNAGDTTARVYAMVTFDMGTLKRDQWTPLRFEWNLEGDAGSCVVMNENGEVVTQIPFNHPSVNGISYVHFITSAQNPDESGFYIRWVSAGAIQ